MHLRAGHLHVRLRGARGFGCDLRHRLEDLDAVREARDEARAEDGRDILGARERAGADDAALLHLALAAHARLLERAGAAVEAELADLALPRLLLGHADRVRVLHPGDGAAELLGAADALGDADAADAVGDLRVERIEAAEAAAAEHEVVRAGERGLGGFLGHGGSWVGKACREKRQKLDREMRGDCGAGEG